MLSLIFSIRFWSKAEDRNRGIAAIVVSAIASILSLARFGVWGLVDVAILAANIIIFLKTRQKDYYY